MAKSKITKTLPILLLLVLVQLFMPPASVSVEASTADNVKVGIYYYPWYIGNWSANHQNCIDTPVLGGYDSSNASLIIQHLNWFSQTGIDFIIFSWWGKYSSSDNNTKLILEQIQSNYTNLQFFIMVEPFNSGWPEAYNSANGTYNFPMIYGYIYDTYVSKYPNCFYLESKPAIGFYDDPSKNLTANGVPDDDRFSTRLIGCHADDDWEYQVPDATQFRVCRDGEVSVCPRYDANGTQVDVNYTEGLYLKQWSNAIDGVRNGTTKLVTIISWNEFAERTAIEPHIDSTATTPPYYLLDLTKAYIDYLHLASYPMKSGILAHEMSQTQAQILSSDGFCIEGDVEINDPSSNWQNIYQLSKQNNIPLIGKLLARTLSFNDSFTLYDWELAVETAVRDYGDFVTIWEIWNEPYSNNLLGFFNGSASSYVSMLEAAYQIIKSASPNATVLGLGGLHLYSADDPWVSIGLDFAREVVSLGGMNYCDAISLHAYPWGKYSASARAQNAFINSIVLFREITGKEVWITEVGQKTIDDNFDQSEQYRFLNQSYQLLRSQNVRAYIWYELNDRGTDTFGLFDINSNPKTAYYTYTSLANNVTQPPPNPTPTPTPSPTSNPTPTPEPTATPSPSPSASPTPTQLPASPTPTTTATPTPASPPLDWTSNVVLFLGSAVLGMVGTVAAYLVHKRIRIKR